MTTSHIWDDRFYNDLLVSDAIGKLRNVRSAISTWSDIAAKEIDGQENNPGAMSVDQRYWYDEYLSHQQQLVCETVETLYAGLAVTVAATIENFMGMLCIEFDAEFPSSSNWRSKREALEKRLNTTKLNDLSGFSEVNRARLLNNCFKHSDSKMDAEWVADCGGVIGEEISYTAEDWDKLIEGARNFLSELVKALPMH